ncbi:hypothetical protein WR164_09100 [Philodulcilactobacillus myokoensis]|uniref:Glycosyltransferase 2-like domain-containing protein n=1 Tax=Philodulcilactobacillus myokoensis TaxID=2929573 RepID=A0A9W6B178_9LACO|nr:CDP-glycerol glycerophosphotransferase family protein [Philodulcilactobacillus myokoensis]GLB46931.1 hypothetical protein WR164_09100 [Philodulcilactobacillus myokoensis]
MNKVDLSVIVACYNVSDTIEECLDSLAATNFPADNMEVLMVDDGSTDSTPEILNRYDYHYSQFKALHKPNGGLSDARNYGIDHSNGKYVVFVDGDDIVPPDAYTDLVYTAETQHSDIVSGFVKRFDSLRNRDSFLHSFAIQDNKYKTTLAKTPSLMYDTTAWNKLYLKSFLNQYRFRFIKDILYEDLPFALATYLKSDNISVINDVVYHWRWRETANSITQSRGDLSNYESRISSLNRCKNELINAGYGEDSLLYQTLMYKVLRIDIANYLENIGNTDEQYIYNVQELTYRFLRDWHLWNSKYMKKLPLKQQIQYYAIKTGNIELLKKYTFTKNIGKFNHSFITNHYHFKIPEISDDVLKHVNMTTNVLRLNQRLSHLSFDPNRGICNGDGMFRIKSLPYVKKLFSSQNVREQITGKLVNLSNHKEMSIKFYRKKTPTYKQLLRHRYGWTNARYLFEFSYPKAIQQLGLGRWKMLVTDTVDHKYTVQGYLGWPKNPNNKILTPFNYHGVNVTNDFDTNVQLTFHAVPLTLIGSNNTNWVKNPQINMDQSLCFEAGIVHPNDVIPILRFNPNSESEENEFDLKGQVVSKNGKTFLKFDPKQVERRFFNHYFTLLLLHLRTNHQIEYQYKASYKKHYGLSYNAKQRVFISYADLDGIKLSFGYRPVIIDKYQLIHKRMLRVSGKLNIVSNDDTNADSFKIELLSRDMQNRYVFNASDINMSLHNQRITFDIPFLNQSLNQLKILKGRYFLKLYLPVNNHVVDLQVKMNHSQKNPRKQLPFKNKDRIYYYVMTSINLDFNVVINQPFSGFLDQKKSYRSIDYSVLYPLMRLLPLKNVMVFDSYWASQFSSNEKSMYEYMQKKHPNIKTVWFFKNRLTPITGNGKRVRVNSLQYWYYLAVAKYIVQNTNMPNQYLKRRGQIETETLHGTFLKHMGFDEPHFKNAGPGTQNKFAMRIRRWDYLVAPSDYMVKTTEHAFDYHQKYIKAGFPRNDELHKHNHQKYIDAIKAKLNIPLNKKVILYAPTFRDNGGFDFPLDLNRMQEHLSDKYVLLVRLHYFVAHSHSFYNQPHFVYDVSDYQNINDLYLISDVLVTDYSSVMFDYAHLMKPIIFYAYDKDWYLNDANRGTYLDYNSQMPGPIVKDETDLIDQINQLDMVKNNYRNQIKQFHDRFAQYGNNGDATAKVVETILNTKSDDLDQEPVNGVIFNKFWHIFKIRNFQSRLLNYLGQILPKRNIMMFESFFGTQFSDNPKAIYNYVKKHYPKYKLYWNVNPEYVDYFKRHHIPYIKRFGYHGIFKQAQAKYWITNARRPFRWDVPRNTILLQTWHGTPLKTIGTDVNLVTMPGNNAHKYHRQVYNDAKRWDYLIAPNMYSNQIMRRAFRKNANQMMLTGYPRNDILINATSEKIRNIKEKLGIPFDRKVVLYAPTWRDNEFIRNGEYTAKLHLDLNQIKERFGNQVTVLIRTHYLIANQLDLSGYGSTAINVSDYEDIAELYLVSDVLITDYSSVMFDYSILKRPIIFFAYDIDQYAGDTRGFYFDFRKQAPGKILTTNHQVINELSNIFNGDWHFDDRYQQFVDRYDRWMDGKSSKRVVEQLLSLNNVSEVTSKQLQESKLNSTMKLADGASMWMEDKDFTDRFDVNFAKNYDQNNDTFNVIKVMQLRSTSFNEKFGMKYALIEHPKMHYRVWVHVDDLIANK